VKREGGKEGWRRILGSGIGRGGEGRMETDSWRWKGEGQGGKEGWRQILGGGRAREKARKKVGDGLLGKLSICEPVWHCLPWVIGQIISL
jgi:hypothetical protein